jgi:hypothetical protein
MDINYESVLDEPQLSLNIWLHLGNLSVRSMPSV